MDMQLGALQLAATLFLLIQSQEKQKKIYQLCLDAGLKLTPVGSTFPYKKDPANQNIRLAPTQVKNSDLKKLWIYLLQQFV